MNYQQKLLQNLRKFYQGNGISAEGFSCPYYKSCKGDCDTFTTAKEPFIGSKYGVEKDLPKIVFISLDSGSGGDPAKNTMEEVRRWEEEEYNPELDKEKNRHWYRTHEFLHKVLLTFRPDVKLSGVNPYFVHTNSAKCCMNKVGRGEASSHLFENCRPFAQQELIILDPDILISQGNKAKWVVENVLSKSKQWRDDSPIFQFADGKLVMWQHMPHPNHWGGFNKQRREEWESMVNAIHIFNRGI